MAGIKVLIVEDSRFFREMFANELDMFLPAGSKIEKASDVYEARSMIRRFRPHVVLLDVQLPGMSGIEFLEQLQHASFATIAISSKEDYREPSLKAGATDFILKPVGIFSMGKDFYKKLADKLVAASESINTFTEMHSKSWCKLIAIGSSTGGTEALTKLLTNLRPPLPPICIVQHIAPAFSKLFAQRLDKECVLRVKEGVTGDELQSNCVYVAPGDKHMQVEVRGGMLRLKCESGPRIHGVLSSADVLFESVAKNVKNGVCGVILTGMGADGAAGLLKIRQAGGRTLGQDEASCVVYGMPKVAFYMGAVERQVSISNMADAITKLVR